ncbi:efflux RND transporter periplasmic adaptor subunit [Paenibacillus sp. GYB004]
MILGHGRRTDRSAARGRGCLTLSLTAVLLAAALLAGCSLLPKRSESGPGLIENVRVKADVWAVKKGTLTVELTGAAIVVPAREKFYSFQVNGTVGEVRVKRGDRVGRGDVLLRLRTADFALSHARQKLAVENMKLALRQSLKSGHPDDIMIDRMNLEIEQLKLSRLLDNQSKSELVSAADGIVTFLDDIVAGSKAETYRNVVGVAPSGALRLQYTGDLSAYAGRIRPGMPVAIQVEGATVSARVAGAPLTISQDDGHQQQAETNENTLFFEFAGPLPDGLTLGASLDFQLELVSKPDVLTIPRRALRYENGSVYVQIADADIRRDTEVQIGLVTRTEAEIVSGLTEGQLVVISP